MIDKFLALGFRNVGQFDWSKNELSFDKLVKENSANVIYAVATDNDALYIGETIHSIDDVLKDLVDGNENRPTRNRIHLLVEEYSRNSIVYLLVNEVSQISKQNLIEQFRPVGNINGLKYKK